MNNWRKAIEQYQKENKEKSSNVEFYDILDVMKVLKIKHRQIIYNKIKYGKLKPCKIGEGLRGKYYFDKEYINGLKK